ncbi:MAG: hypothetical protein R3F33_08420 [Planctomycetota bacterium]
MKFRPLIALVPILLAAPALAATPAPAKGLDVHVGLDTPIGHIEFASHGRRERIPAPRGHYEFREERYWVEGCTRRVWVPDEFRTITDPCGRTRTVLVRSGHYETVHEPGRWEVRTVRVWVEDRPHITPGRRFDDRRRRDRFDDHGRRGRG